MRQLKRTTRLEARISTQALLVVKQAAELQGRSLSDFVVVAAEETARRAIEEAHIVRMSIDDQQRFADLLIDPPALSPAMLRAKNAHEALIGKSADAPIPD